MHTESAERRAGARRSRHRNRRRSRHRRPAVLALLAGVLLATPGEAQEVRSRYVPNPGATIRVTRDLLLATGEHVLPPQGPDGEDGAFRLEGVRGITLDLSGSTVRGAPAGTDLDDLRGFGIVLVDCSDITIRGGTLGGYRGCIVARDCDRITVEGVTFDRWFGQRLRSTLAAEAPEDWLWPHENDEGQWLANYGGAIAATDCSDVVVKGCRGRGGQNGILLNRCGGAKVHDNDFSFLSGWGLAMYRSSNNVVSHNRFDYCVRGYSHGVYWRGQDSAGILMFERCSDNVIAHNSATHGGDGLFVYAGQDRVEGRAVERGEAPAGGCDRNLIYRNDFSYAVANAIEITFSDRNRVIENVGNGCHQHGLWGGYSSRMVVVGNHFQDTRGGGISIEHGQECLIAKNLLHGNEIGLELWWDEDEQFVRGPYGRQFDTRSRDHWVVGNSFKDNDSDLVLKKTTGLRFADNVFEADTRELYLSGLGDADERDAAVSELRGRLAGIGGWLPSGHVSDSTLRADDGTRPPELEAAVFLVPPRVPGTRYVDGAVDPSKPRLESIEMGEWGPWDFESGAPRPAPRLPGGLLREARWDAVWFRWKDGPDPRSAGQVDAWRELAADPVAQAVVGTWLTPWGDSTQVRDAVGATYFGMRARARVELEEDGVYRLSIVSDDGVRLRVDGHTVLENWTWHAPTRDEVELELTAGAHELELEYFQIDGATALVVDLQRAAGD